MKSQPKIHKYTKQNEKLTKGAKKPKKSKGKTKEQSRNGRGTVEEQSRRYFSATVPLLFLCLSSAFVHFLSIVRCVLYVLLIFG